MKIVAISRLLIATGLLTLSIAADAHSWLKQCSIGFDNKFALTHVLANARATFAMHTGISNGSYEVCDPQKHQACWTYRERCGSRGYVRVQEAPIGKYNHFHLSFEDSSLTCFADNGDGLGSGFGRPGPGGSCIAADWKNEPRFAAGHTPDHLMHIWVEDRVTHQPRVFDVASIRVRGTMNAQIWFRKSDGQWFYWPSLAPGRWNLSGYTWNITDVMIRAANGSGTSVSFDDVVVRN